MQSSVCIVHLLCSLVVSIFVAFTSSLSLGDLLVVDVFVIFVMDQANSCRFSRICVFCGSSSGKKSIYTKVAQELGLEMVKRGINLVYGGGSIGLMGTTAKAVKDGGGHVVGIIPKALMPKEICGATVGDLVVVDDMHQRKAEMAHRADAFIALPGGFGTFEEVLEIITWAQLGIHKKPVGLLNVDGYYDSMLALFDKALDQGFLNIASRNIVVHAPTAAALLDNLKNYSPTVDKTVPELTWATTTSVSALSKQNVTTEIDIENDVKAAYDPHFHMINQSCTARGAQVSSTNSRVGIRNNALSMNLTQIGARRRRSGMHAQPSHRSINIDGLSGSVTTAAKFNAPIRALAAFL